MTNIYLQLLKSSGNYKKGKLPDSARAHIALKSSWIEKVNGAEFQVISGECRTSREITESSDWLIKELNEIKKQALKFFKKEEEKRLKSKS